MSDTKHPTEINGWESSLPELARAIHQMRYDRVEEFYRHAAAEIDRQATGDRQAGRPQLAELLEEAARSVHYQRYLFLRIWILCRQHMDNG